MSRRCKAGQRARIINGDDKGKIVVVVRPYHYPEKVGGAKWPHAIFPWVVTSLSTPLNWSTIEDRNVTGKSMTIVSCDLDLEPLKDDDDGLTRSTEKGKPKPVAKTKPKAVLVDDSTEA